MRASLRRALERVRIALVLLRVRDLKEVIKRATAEAEVRKLERDAEAACAKNSQENVYR